VEAAKLAQKTTGLSGADIKNIVNIAAINAVKNGRTAAAEEDF
jgi:ATP-dependent metalloprotease